MTTNEPKHRWVIFALLFVVVAWSVNLALLVNIEERGLYGDMFGSVNALFSGLAFVGVIYAIILQQVELKLQRMELRQTREELKGQKDALTAQNETAMRQNFDNTFFQLLRLHNDIVNSIDIKRKTNSDITGRDCFRFFYDQVIAYTNKNNVANDRDRYVKGYMQFYGTYESDVGHYFRSLYNIIKFVDQSEVPDKRLYTNLVRAQLSNIELLLLFYNCLCDVGKKFTPLVEEYALLKHLPVNRLMSPDMDQGYFSKTAYE